MSRATDLIESGDTLPETDVPLCLKGSLQAAYEKAQRDLEQAEANADVARIRGRRLAEEDPHRALRTRIAELAEEMQPHILLLRLRALSRPKFRKLRTEHPPRQDDGKVMDVDQAVGVNIETFFDALVRRCVAGSVDVDAAGEETVEPLTDEYVTMLLDERISDGQWKTLADSAWSINRRDVALPFSPSSLLPTPNS